jgi:hypothetical protein
MLWRILTAFSQQIEWPINGCMQKISKEDWKVILSASFRAEMARLTQTTDGRIVMLGVSTSRMSKREFTEFIEFLLAVAAERGVVLELEESGTKPKEIEDGKTIEATRNDSGNWEYEAA